MIANRRSLSGHPRAVLVVQAVTFVALIAVLVPMVSGNIGTYFLLAIVGGIGAFWLVQRPHWGVLIILGTWFVEIDALAGLSYVVSAVLLVSLGMTILRDRGCWALGVPQIQILLVIAFLFLLSTWWAEFKYPITLFPQKDQTARQMREFTTHLAWLVFFLYFITTRKKIELTVRLVVGLIVAAAASALYLFVTSQGADRASAAFSFAGNSNRLAYVCLFATTLVWFYRLYGPAQGWKVLTLPLIFFLPMGALAAGSRSGLLQLATLGVLVVIDQKGWSAAKRMYSVFCMGLVGLMILALVPHAYLERATTFDPDTDAPGQESLQTRLHVITSALKMIGSDPIFGAGIGNFPWVARAFYGSSGHTHNSYLWALVAGGIGVFALYLLLFYLTYRMLRQLERSGPQDLLWLSKGLRVSLVLFMIFSAFADFWLSDFMYLLIGLTISMTYLWRRQQQLSSNMATVPSVRFESIGSLVAQPRG